MHSFINTGTSCIVRTDDLYAVRVAVTLQSFFEDFLIPFVVYQVVFTEDKLYYVVQQLNDVEALTVTLKSHQ